MGSSVVWILGLSMLAPGTPATETERLQVGGEWCFIKTPPRDPRPGEAVILIHGNGETVEAVDAAEAAMVFTGRRVFRH